MELPIYLFTGFLESGKTRLINESLADPQFNAGEKTLVILCEEGEEEYTLSSYPYPNVVIETIEESSEISEKKLKSLASKHKPERIIIEYNGMWTLDNFFNAMPKGWFIYQEVMLVDATTFLSYNANMRSLVVDKLKTCEMVLFNRASDATPKDEFHKIVRAISRGANIAYEDLEGNVEYDETIDPLPFDIDAPVIEIADRDYALWYRDMSEDIPKYDGKTVKFKGIVVTDKLPKDTFLAGRHVMTCCAADISYHGLACKLKSGSGMLKTRDWIIVTGTIKYEFFPLYGDKGPVLYVDDYSLTSRPEPEVATFN